MKIITDSISITELREMAGHFFGNYVKAVVDLERGLMVVDASMHADQEVALLDDGSNQVNLWGINIYPDEEGEAFLEFDSMINLRPRFGNFTRGVDDAEIRARIEQLVAKLVTQ